MSKIFTSPDSIYLAAFALGLLSSLHCVGMCGPIQLLLPFQKGKIVFTRLIYHAGRIGTYILLGIILGFFGFTLAISGWQNYMVLAAGILMLLFVLMPERWIFRFGGLTYFTRFKSSLIDRMSRSKDKSYFLFGALNGMVPCGMVYVALAGSIGTGSPQGGALFMSLFGLGTFPLMWVASISIGFFSSKLRFGMSRINSFLIATVAVLLIIRGLNLDIPFIAPKPDFGNNSTVITCE